MQKQTVYDFVEAINNHNIDNIYNLMADSFVFIDTYGCREEGREHMRESWVGYFGWFPDYKIEADEMLQEGNIVVILGFASGTYQNKTTPQNDNYWRLPAVWRVVVNDGKIKQWQVYCDSKIPYEIIGRNQ